MDHGGNPERVVADHESTCTTSAPARRASTSSPMRLNLQEARALLLATRLFLRYSDEGDPFAASAIGQLAGVMPLPVRDQVLAAASSLRRRPLDAEFSRHLGTITDAWARRRLLRISYRSAGKQRAKEVIVEPYF